MKKKRIYTIAEELGMPSKELIERLVDLGYNVTNALATFTEEEAEVIIEMLKEDKASEKKSKQAQKDKKNRPDELKEEDERKDGKIHEPKKNKNEHDDRAKEDRRSAKNQDNRHDKHSLKDEKNDNKKDYDNKKDFKKDRKKDKYKDEQNQRQQENQSKHGQDKFAKQQADNRAKQPQEKRQNQEKNQQQENKHTQEKPKNEKRPPKGKNKDEQIVKEQEEIVQLPETVVVGEFAGKIGIPATQVIMSLMKMGIMANINQSIKYETAEKIAFEFDRLVEPMPKEEEQEDIIIKEDSEEDLKPRPPIVTVMGHVDHGKTSLLDAIRNTNKIAQEAGGITQHIGAYEVYLKNKKVVFLDTPGHEAFTQMRMRGAQVTDIAILVVAADDGIKPQTIEAISHAKAAKVPIIVAINKIDKETANIDKVRQELSENGLIVEQWGGDIIDVPISAKKNQNIDKLLEMILLVAEMEELKANPNRPAVGTVVESNIDKGRGPVATVIVSNGTLKVGDPVIAGTAYGKIRALINDKGKRVKKAPPSTPVEILGLDEVPKAGDKFIVMQSEKAAKAIVEKRRIKSRDERLEASSKITLEDVFDKMQKGEIKQLDIVLKADVQGSLEAIRQSLEKISTDEVNVNIIHGSVGAITDSDIMLASASNAIVIGFNVRPSATVIALSEREQVNVRTYRIIYELIEDIEKAMKGMLDPEFKEVVLGQAEVRQTFKASGVGTIAGSYVISGKIKRNASARLIRNGIVVYDGELASLKRFKDDAKEVLAGYECGITLDKYNDIKEQDIIEVYEMQEIER